MSAEIDLKNNWPGVSVIVPVRNGAATLRDCIEALLMQDYLGEVELLIVNNASMDGTSRILTGFPNRIIVCEESKRGASAARNTGIRRASNELVAFTDVDCIPQKCWLQELVKTLLHHPEATFVGGRIAAREPTSPVGKFAEVLFDQRAAIERFDPPYVITANALARWSDLTAFGLFNEEYLRGQDTEFSFRAFFSYNARFAYNDAAVVEHMNVSNVTGLWNKGLQHGKGSARLWKDFQKKLHCSPGARMCEWKPYWYALRESVKALPALVQAERREPESLFPFYGAIFNLGKQVGFVYGSLVQRA